MLPDDLPYLPYVIWKKKLIGECCYDRIICSLKPESLTGDTALVYSFEGIFLDDDGKRYRILQDVTAGPGNAGYARILKIQGV